MAAQTLGPRKSAGERLWAIAIWALVIFFIVNFVAMIATVVVNSFGTRWLGTWLPAGYTTRWYGSAWQEFQLDDVLIVTFQVVGAVVLRRRRRALYPLVAPLVIAALQFAALTH